MSQELPNGDGFFGRAEMAMNPADQTFIKNLAFQNGTRHHLVRRALFLMSRTGFAGLSGAVSRDVHWYSESRLTT